MVRLEAKISLWCRHPIKYSLRCEKIPKKCLTLGLCLEYETFIRGVFCPNLFVCLCVCLCVCLFVCMSAFFENDWK